MTTTTFSGHLPGATTTTVRDELASDVDDRVLVTREVVHTPARTERTTWPVPRRRRGLPVGWPIAAMVAGWPIWWSLGVQNIVFPLLAVPLAWSLLQRGRVKVPPGFWIWCLFLLLVLVSGLALDAQVESAATSDGIGRYLAFGLRYANYLAVTVILLFLGNTSEAELPRRRVIRWLALLGVSCIVLGAVSVLAPTFGFRTPASYVLPGALTDEGASRVTLAQYQPILGDPAPRPSAPFSFTNAWGNNLTLLLVWIAVGWGVLGSRRRQLAMWVLLALATVPIIYSLNRGMWLGLGIGVVVVAVRLALRGRVRALAALMLCLTLAGFGVSASSLDTMVQSRLETGHSNSVRGSLLNTSLDLARQSPLIGFGSTRKTLGSDASIAIGPSESCPRCGARNVGSTGQLTLLLVSQGLVGTLLYFAFLGFVLLRYLRDHSVLGIAATLVIGLEILYAGFYSALTMPLAIVFVSIGLLWRNDGLRRAAVAP